MCMQADAMTARAMIAFEIEHDLLLKSRKEEESIKKAMQETVEV